jgi:hypothetical protein
VLVAAAVVSAGAGTGMMTAAAPASATPTIGVVSTAQWGPDLAGYEHVVGQLVNNGPGVASDVEVDLDLYNSANQLLDSGYTYASIVDLNPGERSPFEGVFPPPAGYHHYRISGIIPDPHAYPPNHFFTTTVTNRFKDTPGNTHIVGTVRNNNLTAASDVEAVFTFYNAAGRTVATDFTDVNTSNGNLSGGQTASFEETLFTGDPTFPAFTTYSIVTQSLSTPHPAPTFSPRPGAATSIAVGANNSVWVVGTNPAPGGYGIYRWTGTGWNPVAGGAVSIAVDPGGNPWVINSAHQIYHRVGNGWARYPGAATSIGVGANGSVWITGTNPTPGGYGIYRWTGTRWNPVAGGAVSIAVDPGGNPWVVNSAHQIYHRVGNGWARYPGAATSIGVGANGSVWITGTNPTPGGYAIYCWYGSAWTPVAGGAVSVAVGRTGNPWVINAAHQIYSS